jgi:asparagine synthase (glutamine-hydrolysing)
MARYSKAMCGIAGFYLREGQASLATVRAMCDQIRHRGPDDEGYHVEGGCAIGMRRLSIIDLSTGHQPMANEDESVWVVFNGEIYNYQELRRDLRARGHRFVTNSDTETLVHLYEEQGAEGLRRLRGMFAYAIWDARSGDFTGARPLWKEAALLCGVAGGALFRKRAEMPACRRCAVRRSTQRRCGSSFSSRTSLNR